MQKLIATILFAAFFGQTFNQGFYYLNYLADKAQYEKNCVNKLRPQLKCHGKCQLMKKLEEQERQQAPAMKLAAKTEVLSSKSSYPHIASFVMIQVATPFVAFNEDITVDRPRSIFHPPSA